MDVFIPAYIDHCYLILCPVSSARIPKYIQKQCIFSRIGLSVIFGVRLGQLVPQQKQLCILTCTFLISYSMCQLLEMIYINLSILLNVQTSYSSLLQSQFQHKFCRSSNACKFLRLVFDVTQKISVSGKTSDLENAF